MGIEKIVGLLQIGQSEEKPDPDFAQLASKDDTFRFITVAPLDAYTEPELLEKFRPAPDELPISSVIKSGERILISHSALVFELQKGVREAEDCGFGAVLVTCTGSFDLDTTSVPIILPGKILRDRVQAQQDQLRMVAVWVPVDEQQRLLTARWVGRLPDTVQVQAFTISPQSSLDKCRQMAKSLASSGFDTVIMDCFGYSLAQTEAVKGCVSRVFNAKAVALDYIKTSL